ncbi:hypothetical protein OM074_02265 [Marinilabiliaceae bacterium D04]|uniref:Outer membrane protein beta-barrel domain-containing protein n=2 Tax=Plebeiibacterium marinum TaxID=2992111 RepID=A0AAE3SII6_9BACT|nr:hypothetical protein [Plebeiobacterium marinum]
MKKVILLFAIVLAATAAKAQFSVGADLVSRYVFRGLDYGNGAALQPTIEYSTGGFAIGAWGSYGLTAGSFTEADLYLSYGFDFGLSLGLTDYYYPGTDWTNFEDKNSAHAIEFNLGYETGGLSLAGNYMLNNSEDNAGAENGTKYFEAGYSFDNLDIFIGAGDGWHSMSGDFEVVNIGIGTSKEIKFSESFSLPVFGQAIVNPNTEQFHIVVGLSL